MTKQGSLIISMNICYLLLAFLRSIQKGNLSIIDTRKKVD